MKIIRDKTPSILHSKIMPNYYEEPRKLNAGRLFDNSTLVVGRPNDFSTLAARFARWRIKFGSNFQKKKLAKFVSHKEIF